MREIKVRVWNGKDLRYFNLDIGDLYEMEGHLVRNPGSFITEHTGLKDKNGKEIYEGDVVRHDIGEEHEWGGVHEVIFSAGAFLIRGGKPHGMRYGEPFNWYPHNLEVIGNIYESPELLEGK